MIYSYPITFAAGTDESSQEEFTLPLSKGLIYLVEFRFPPGSSGLTRFRIYYQGYQLYPKNNLGYFNGNDDTIRFDDTQLIDVIPYQLILRGYNLDVTWEHEIFLRIGVISEEKYLQRYLPNIAEKIIREENERNEEKATIEKASNIIINLPFRSIL